MATLLPTGEQTFFDANGKPLSGGTVTFYIPGTTTAKDTWQDSGQTTLNSNPVVLDSAGRAIIYGAGAYRQVVKDSAGNLIWDQLTADTSSSQISWSGTSTGSANAQNVTASNFTFSSGQQVSFIAGYTNTGALTLNVNNGGALSVLQDGTTGVVALGGGEVVAGAAINVLYDETIGAFHLISGASTARVNTLVQNGFATGMVAPFANLTVPAGWLKADGSAKSRTTYAALFAALVRSSTATITIATPAVFTWANHGLEDNAAVKFSSTGSLPTGLTAGTNYFVYPGSQTTNTFQVYAVSTVTISIASPGVVTWNNHRLNANDPVIFTTTGNLTSGLTAGTTYYVVGASITTNTFQVSATSGGSAINTTGNQSGTHTIIGPALSTSGTQSGTHTAINAPYGDGDGATTFNLPDLRAYFIRGFDNGRGVDPYRSFGSAQSSQNKSHTHTFTDPGHTHNSGNGDPFITASVGGSRYAAGSVGSNANTTASATTGITMDANGAADARPFNISMMYCIKY